MNGNCKTEDATRHDALMSKSVLHSVTAVSQSVSESL